MTLRVRVYQLAKQLGFAPKDFESTVRSLGFDIKNYMSTLDAEQVRRVREHVAALSRPSSPVVRRGSASPQPVPEPAPNSSSAPASASEREEPSRVIRNERGVIVGVRRESGPKILGFVPVSTTRRRRDRIETPAPKEDRSGRASRRKQREQKRREAERRRMRSARRTRRRRLVTNTAAPMRPENRVVRIDGSVRAQELARQMGQKTSALLKELWKLGLRKVTPDYVLDADTAALAAECFGYRAHNVGFDETQYVAPPREAGASRAPVVTVLGHVDHGKTTLLDAIRHTNVAGGEAGGITQRLGAYKVATGVGEVVFLDTPGHEAFSSMRSRGADVTDIALLVVAADDGVMPTTVESIRVAHEAGVPVVVAVNKIDKLHANPGRVKQQLMVHGLVGEEFGGTTVIREVSATTGAGLEGLLESLALQSEVLELRAPKHGPAQAVVLDARIEKGRGPAATVLVQAGALEVGAHVVVGEHRGKVRSLLVSDGRHAKRVGPSTVVRVYGLDALPAAGATLVSVRDEGSARAVTEHRARTRQVARRSNVVSITEFLRRRAVPAIRLVLKADERGTLDVLHDAVAALSSEQVRIEIVHAGVGAVGEGDAKLARASGGRVVAFNVKIGPRAAALLEAERIPVRSYDVIYELLDELRAVMAGLLTAERHEQLQGRAEVRALFRVPRVGVVAGCRVVEGSIERRSLVRVLRAGEVVFEGAIASLRIRRDDVAEVGHEHECGIALDGFDDVREGDEIAAFEVTEVAPSVLASL